MISIKSRISFSEDKYSKMLFSGDSGKGCENNSHIVKDPTSLSTDISGTPEESRSKSTTQSRASLSALSSTSGNLTKPSKKKSKKKRAAAKAKSSVNEPTAKVILTVSESDNSKKTFPKYNDLKSNPFSASTSQSSSINSCKETLFLNAVDRETVKAVMCSKTVQKVPKRGIDSNNASNTLVDKSSSQQLGDSESKPKSSTSERRRKSREQSDTKLKTTSEGNPNSKEPFPSIKDLQHVANSITGAIGKITGDPPPPTKTKTNQSKFLSNFTGVSHENPLANFYIKRRLFLEKQYPISVKGEFAEEASTMVREVSLERSTDYTEISHQCSRADKDPCVAHAASCHRTDDGGPGMDAEKFHLKPLVTPPAFTLQRSISRQKKRHRGKKSYRSISLSHTKSAASLTTKAQTKHDKSKDRDAVRGSSQHQLQRSTKSKHRKTSGRQGKGSKHNRKPIKSPPKHQLKRMSDVITSAIHKVHSHVMDPKPTDVYPVGVDKGSGSNVDEAKSPPARQLSPPRWTVKSELIEDIEAVKIEKIKQKSAPVRRKIIIVRGPPRVANTGKGCKPVANSSNVKDVKKERARLAVEELSRQASAVASPEGSPPPRSSRGNSQSPVNQKSPKVMLEEFHAKLRSIKGKKRLSPTSIPIISYPTAETRQVPSLRNIPKTYQQLGLAPLTRSASSENYFPRMAQFLRAQDKPGLKSPTKSKSSKKQGRSGKKGQSMSKKPNLAALDKKDNTPASIVSHSSKSIEMKPLYKTSLRKNGQPPGLTVPQADI